ncbi:LuxR C-terminal-related transcriptional regulator [Streptomyces albidus (ex Kaewkla and Franco 2022)]|uniref:LuxR C-terminal-related transcriptional regulator n=1 Tax=Streptomyces albidus (ex Kaewkla and Franco 2022) TaxID=722709 RepID=UPI0015EEED6E|nr:LuxR family transcriptional regulator [Streptomyces albidus (ex Kaewkla and Franco 2022)]
MDDSRIAARRANWPLFGRDEELDYLTQALSEYSGMVIFGQAGVGKSRLAEECLAGAERSGFRVGRAVASTAARTVPLGAIAHLLPTGVDLSDPVKGFAAVADALRGSNSQDSQDRYAVFVDDIHLLDATSAMLLRQLMDAGVITLIATIRTGEPPSEAVQALTSGESVRHVELNAFDLQQTEALLQEVLGGPVGQRTVRDLHQVSGGNVLFLRELVRGALEGDALVNDGEVWEADPCAGWNTMRLTELIRVKVDSVSGCARDALELLACCGALPLTAIEATAPLGVLVDLERNGLIHFDTDRRRTRVSLTHPLYEEVLRADVPALTYRATQLEQADRIEALGARRRGDALRIATWRLDASGEADPALLRRAASLAHYAHDHPQTLAFLNALPEQHHDTGTRLMQGEAYFHTGQPDLADAVLAQAAESTHDEPARLAITVTRTTNLLVSNAPIAEVLQVNEAARADMSIAPVRDLLLINEGFIKLASGRPVAGLALLDRLEPEVDQALDRRMWLCAAAVRTVALALVGRIQEATVWAERAHVAHQQTHEEARPAHPAVQQGTLALALAEAGRLDEAVALCESVSVDLARHSPILRVFPALLNARTQWVAGRPATSRRMYAELAALARREDHVKALRIALSGLAACASVLGDVDAAQGALAELRTLPDEPPGYFSVGEELLGDAWLLAAGGHQSKARQVLRTAADAARSTGHITSEGLLLTEIARLGGAKDVTDRLSEIAEECDGDLAAVRAQFASSLAAGEPAQLLEAAERFEAMGSYLQAAEAAAAAADLWRRRGEGRQATAATVRSDTVAAAHCQGAETPLLDTVRTTTPLTSREREISTLAAAGETSKEIAAALTLSVRTVDNHLQKAYAKLGIATRRELAAHLRQSRPPGVGA